MIIVIIILANGGQAFTVRLQNRTLSVMQNTALSLHNSTSEYH